MAEALARTGTTRVRVYGASMSPAIRSGDVVNITTCKPADVRTGDIVACIREAGLVVHRVVWKSRRRIWLKGDTLAGTDPPMPHGLVFGRVVGVETPEGRVDLTTARARRTNIFILLYMIPFSLALALARTASGPSRAEQTASPASQLRRILEWLPGRAVRGLISKTGD